MDMIYMALFSLQCGKSQKTKMTPPPPLRPEPTSGLRQLRHTSTPFQFLNSDAYTILFLIISLSFIFILLISPFYSFSFHFFKPQSTRKSLDFLSLALVLFAIACGLMNKNNGENIIHEEISRAAAATTSNDSKQIHKSNPSIPIQWNFCADRMDQILLHHPPEVAGGEYWRLSGGDYVTNYQSPSSDSVQHCQNLKDFEEGFDFKRASKATFSVYDEEIYSSSLALNQFSVPPLMSPLQLSLPPSAVVEAEVEKINEGDGSVELRLDFQTLEDEISTNEKQREVEGRESKRSKKNKMKNWKRSVDNFNGFIISQHQHHQNLSPPPAALLPAAIHHYQNSSKIGETKKDFPVSPPSPPVKLIPVIIQNSTGGQPPSTAAEIQIVMKEENLRTRNENTERKGAMFCGSPDVNSKADSFIERFREGLKLERMNSIKERQRKTRTSILGRKGQE